MRYVGKRGRIQRPTYTEPDIRRVVTGAGDTIVAPVVIGVM